MNLSEKKSSLGLVFDNCGNYAKTAEYESEINIRLFLEPLS